MSTVIKTLIGGLIRSLFGGGGQDLTTVVQGIQQALQFLANLFQDDLNVQFQEHGAVSFVQPLAHQIGHDFEQIQGTNQSYWNRLFDVILPQSFAHLVGFVYSDGIVPLRVDSRFIHHTLDGLQTWQSQVAAWVANVATPELAELENFKAYIIKYWQPTVATVYDWLTNPGHFGEWAAAPITGPVVAYLAGTAHAETRDNLARIMVDAWSEVPNDVWESILRWAVT